MVDFDVLAVYYYYNNKKQLRKAVPDMNFVQAILVILIILLVSDRFPGTVFSSYRMARNDSLRG